VLVRTDRYDECLPIYLYGYSREEGPLAAEAGTMASPIAEITVRDLSPFWVRG